MRLRAQAAARLGHVAGRDRPRGAGSPRALTATDRRAPRTRSRCGGHSAGSAAAATRSWTQAWGPARPRLPRERRRCRDSAARRSRGTGSRGSRSARRRQQDRARACGADRRALPRGTAQGHRRTRLLFAVCWSRMVILLISSSGERSAQPCPARSMDGRSLDDERHEVAGLAGAHDRLAVPERPLGPDESTASSSSGGSARRPARFSTRPYGRRGTGAAFLCRIARTRRGR